MKWLAPLSDDDMNDDQAKRFDRAKSKLGLEEDDEVPTWLRILANSPEFLKDTYMNLDRQVFKDDALDESLKLVLAAVTAAHHGVGDVAEWFSERAIEAGFTEEQVVEAVGIAATSTSFNHYYKFQSLAGDEDFSGFNPSLRATLFMRPSTGKAFAELVNLVISTANGCPSCVTGHIESAKEQDVTKSKIDEAIRTGAIVASICKFLHSSDYYSD